MTAQPCKVALLTLAMALVDSTETTKSNATLAEFSLSLCLSICDELALRSSFLQQMNAATSQALHIEADHPQLTFGCRSL